MPAARVLRGKRTQPVRCSFPTAVSVASRWDVRASHSAAKASRPRSILVRPAERSSGYSEYTAYGVRSGVASPPPSPLPPMSPGMCENTCLYPEDSMCDDGGPGSAYAGCTHGHDCTDCGVRPFSLPALPSAPPLPPASLPFAPPLPPPPGPPRPPPHPHFHPPSSSRLRPRPPARSTASRINGGKASNKGVAKSK
eukprot:6551585-Prymnesium_polylepis.1